MHHEEWTLNPSWLLNDGFRDQRFRKNLKHSRRTWLHPPRWPWSAERDHCFQYCWWYDRKNKFNEHHSSWNGLKRAVARIMKLKLLLQMKQKERGLLTNWKVTGRPDDSAQNAFSSCFKSFTRGQWKCWKGHYLPGAETAFQWGNGLSGERKTAIEEAPFTNWILSWTHSETGGKDWEDDCVEMKSNTQWSYLNILMFQS